MSHFYGILLRQYVGFLCYYFLLKLFVLIHFHAKPVSVYVHFDFLCWYLAFSTS